MTHVYSARKGLLGIRPEAIPSMRRLVAALPASLSKADHPSGCWAQLQNKFPLSCQIVFVSKVVRISHALVLVVLRIPLSLSIILPFCLSGECNRFLWRRNEVVLEAMD